MSAYTKIAVVGFGLIGKRHAQIIQRIPHLSLVAIVEPNETARNNAKTLNVPIYDDIETMVNKESPDGIILATPTPLHLDQGLHAIKMNIPILIEKPITVTANDAYILTDAAQKANVPLLVGHHRRHNGMVQAAKEAIMKGMIGDIRAIQATCWFYKPNYYFEQAPWRTQKGAGPISVNLVHDVDLLRHFCGEVKSVQAVAVQSRRGFENEDLATAILHFTSGAIATISVSDSIVAPWSWEMTARENPAYPATNESCYLIGGALGGMSLPDLRIWHHDDRLDWWQPISARSMLYNTEDPLVTQMLHFAQVIKGEATPLVSGIEGLKSLEVVEAVAQSSASNREIFIASTSH